MGSVGSIVHTEILEIHFYNKVLENLIIITSIENHKKICNQRL